MVTAGYSLAMKALQSFLSYVRRRVIEFTAKRLADADVLDAQMLSA
jgi:hypothetical protein